jgi:phosphohistidine phosphatase
LKTVYLLRHAEAGNALNDLERDLTAWGRRQAESIGRWMSENGIIPDLIFSSTAKRAKLTAKICSEKANFQGRISFEEDLYDTDENTYVDLLAGLNDQYDSVMIVGHNPEISDVITIFTGEKLNMSPCTLVCIEFAIEEWSAVQEDNGILKLDKISL